MGNELRECPFCGSRDVSFMDDWYDDGGEHMTVFCNSCRAMLSPKERPSDEDGNPFEEGSDQYEDIKDELISRWNSRGSSCSLVEDVIKTAERVLGESKSHCNSGVSDEHLRLICDLDDRLKVLKDQFAREQVKLPETSNREAESPRREAESPRREAEAPREQDYLDSIVQAVVAEEAEEAAPVCRDDLREHVLSRPCSPAESPGFIGTVSCGTGGDQIPSESTVPPSSSFVGVIGSTNYDTAPGSFTRVTVHAPDYDTTTVRSSSPDPF